MKPPPPHEAAAGIRRREPPFVKPPQGAAARPPNAMSFVVMWCGHLWCGHVICGVVICGVVSVSRVLTLSTTLFTLFTAMSPEYLVMLTVSDAPYSGMAAHVRHPLVV